MYFGGQKPENDFIKIYQIDKENSIYSMFTENDYIDEKNNKMDLAEALEKGVISIEEILEKMEVYGALNDGGTLKYKYQKDEKKLANIDFFIYKCKSFKEGSENIKYNQNIYIGASDFENPCRTY
ncbi:MAG: hypothetical protein HFJ02_02270 [Bacilli bacterium]|nr:hypothetical protein [Bacilli bacterium]